MEAAPEVNLPILIPAAWSGQIAAWLLPACHENPDALEKLRQRVEAGRATLLGVYHDDELTAACVIASDGADAEVMALGGSWPLGNLPGVLLPILELGFRNAGIRRLTIPTFRRGLMRTIRAAGYEPDHIAFSKALA